MEKRAFDLIVGFLCFIPYLVFVSKVTSDNNIEDGCHLEILLEDEQKLQIMSL